MREDIHPKESVQIHIKINLQQPVSIREDNIGVHSVPTRIHDLTGPKLSNQADVRAVCTALMSWSNLPSSSPISSGSFKPFQEIPPSGWTMAHLEFGWVWNARTHKVCSENVATGVEQCPAACHYNGFLCGFTTIRIMVGVLGNPWGSLCHSSGETAGVIHIGIRQPGWWCRWNQRQKKYHMVCFSTKIKGVYHMLGRAGCPQHQTTLVDEGDDKTLLVFAA